MSADRWVLVPVEPTEAMVTRAEAIDWGDSDVRGSCINAWHAMLAAAPAAPEPHIDGWPLYSGLPPAVPAAEPVVATVTECEACFTPDVCQLRGTCDHYPAEKLRVKAAPGAAPAQSREPLTEEQRMQLFVELNASCVQADSPSAMFTLIVQAVERAHGIGSQP